MTTAVKKIYEEVQALSEEERRELDDALHRPSVSSPDRLKEEEILRRLEAEGVIQRATRPLGEAAPVPITGKPVSEILIEDRG